MAGNYSIILVMPQRAVWARHCQHGPERPGTDIVMVFGGPAKFLWSGIVGAAKQTWDTITAGAKLAWDAITAVAKFAWGGVTATAKVAWDIISAAAEESWIAGGRRYHSSLQNYMGYCRCPGKIIWAGFVLVAKVAWDTIVAIVSVALDLVTGHWGRAWDDMQEIWRAGCERL